MKCNSCEFSILPRNVVIKHDHKAYCIATGVKIPLPDYPEPDPVHCVVNEPEPDLTNSPEYLKIMEELSDIQPPELRMLKAERILKIVINKR